MTSSYTKEPKKKEESKDKPEVPVTTKYWTNGMTKTEIAFSNVGIMAAIIVVAFSIIFTICYNLAKAHGVAGDMFKDDKKQGYMPMVQE